MGYVEDALRLSWISNLRQLSGKPKYGLKEWIGKKSYALTNVGQDEFTISDIEAQGALKALSYDINKMAIGSFESLAHTRTINELPRSLSWVAIKLYYSSFYAANTLLRMNGRIPTYLEALDVSKIKSMAFGVNGPIIKPGEYVGTYRNGYIDFMKSDRKSHEVVWSELLFYLQRVEAAYKNSNALQEDKSSLSKLIKSATDCLTQGNCPHGNWPSQMRNKINYRYDFGVWFPYDNSVDYRHLSSLINKTLSTMPEEIHMIPTGDLGSLISVCAFINQLCKTSIVDMASRCPKGRSFLKDGTIEFMKLASVA